MTDEIDIDEIDIDAIVSSIPRPRDQHYMFAHVALPQIVLGFDPGKVDLAELAADHHYFRQMWDDLAQFVEAEPLSNEGLELAHRRADELEVLVVTLPRAEIPSEAIMVAIVRRPVRRWLVLRGHELRYFTLELGVKYAGLAPAGSRTVLCEWNEDGHSNYGDGPPAGVDEFAAAVFDKCRSS